MTLRQALAIVEAILEHAPGPLSVFVAEEHGELAVQAGLSDA